MREDINKWRRSPFHVRVVPFALFAAATLFQGWFGEQGLFWVYAIKTLMGAGLVWWMWPFVLEARWKISAEAVLVGVALPGDDVVAVGVDGDGRVALVGAGAEERVDLELRPDRARRQQPPRLERVECENGVARPINGAAAAAAAAADAAGSTTTHLLTPSRTTLHNDGVDVRWEGGSLAPAT